MKKFLVLIFALVACAPALFSSKEWVRITFVPTREERSTACDRGVANGAARDFRNLIAGVANLAQEGDLTFFSSLGSVYVYCYFQGVAGRRPADIPSASAFVTYTVSEKSSVPSVFIYFKDENANDLGKLEANDSSREKDTVYYSFGRFSASALDQMTKAAYFEVATVLDNKEQRFKVTKEMFGAPLQAKIPHIGMVVK